MPKLAKTGRPGPAPSPRRGRRETSSVDGGSLFKKSWDGAHGAGRVFREPASRRKGQAALREAQASLAHVCRVNTMGLLAASIVHEVNQPLSAVVTNGTACLQWLARVDGDSSALAEARAAVLRIIRDGSRAGDIVAQTRALFRKSGTAKGPLDLNNMIQRIIVLTRSELAHHSVGWQLNLAENLPPAFGDEVQVQQVMINLVLNAIEAMDAVQTRPRELVITTRSVEPGRVCVEVQDSGIGLEPAQTEEIFASFYSSKPGGMGMGLSISRSIAEDHGGSLCALANEQIGATFRLTLLQDVSKGSVVRFSPGSGENVRSLDRLIPDSRARSCGRDGYEFSRRQTGQSVAGGNVS